MPMRYYRLTVIGCAMSWFLIGLHFPAFHQMTHHGREPSWTVVVVLTLLGTAAVAGMWRLLRSRDSGARLT